MSACSRCGAIFACGMVDGDARKPCWCTELPALPASALNPADEKSVAKSCYCPACLRMEIDSLSLSAKSKK